MKIGRSVRQVVRPELRRPHYHTCHILPPSEIPWRLFLAVLQAQKENTYFTELAERVEYGNYDYGVSRRAQDKSARVRASRKEFERDTGRGVSQK